MSELVAQVRVRRPRAKAADMFRTLDDIDVRSKRVLVRVDLNVPVENGKVADTTRIERVAPTIREIADKGGKAILLSHLGRPKGPDPTQSLKLVAPAIAAVLKRPIAFAEDCIGEKAAAAVNAMKPGDILCLEHTRFHPGEERNDPGFVAQLAALGGRQGNGWMQVERNVERLRALEDRPKPLVVEKDIVGEAMDEHFRIAHAFGANEERRQYISAFAE